MESVLVKPHLKLKGNQHRDVRKVGWTGRDFASWIAGGMARELEEELGIQVKDVKKLQYLGFARELGRAGKPQVFFFLDLQGISFESIYKLWTTYTPAIGDPSSRAEYKGLREFTAAEAVKLISDKSKDVNSACRTDSVSEELRMCLALALRKAKII